MSEVFRGSQLDTLLSERRVSQCEFNVNDRKVNFTRRELSCLYFFAQGKSSKEIANILQISPRTVESYINGIKVKTGISYKSELISFFLKTLSDENLEKPLFLKL